MRESQRTGRLRLRHMQEHNEATGEKMALHRDRFEALADPQSAARAVSAFNLFQTPEPIAGRMAAMITTDGRILEPSAGLGRIYRAIRYRTNSHITMVEQSPECAAELYRESEGDDHCTLVQGDFLGCQPADVGMFDWIVMNPPFKMGRDVKHIKHALTLLAPGGMLIALCYAGTKQHAHLQPIADTWEILPPGSFRAEGTGADVALLTIRN